jgi:hypothetical protein
VKEEIMSFLSARAELVTVAEAMLNGELQLIEGCRRICSLRHSVGDPENAAFLPIRGIESETDHFPLGEMRKQCAPEYLARADENMNRYLTDASKDILAACREIIRAFS